MSKERKLKRAEGRKGVREVGEGGREGGRGATAPKAVLLCFGTEFGFASRRLIVYITWTTLQSSLWPKALCKSRSRVNTQVSNKYHPNPKP